MVTRPERMRAGPARGPSYSRARLTTNLLRFVRVTKYLIAGVTVTIFCVSWIASVNNSADNEWRGVRWSDRRGGGGLPTMRTIVGYSEDKQAEMDRPSPVACGRLPAFPRVPFINRTWSLGVEESSWQEVEGRRVSLYAAFYDDRISQHYVRILAKFEGRNFSSEEPLFCQTRSRNPNEHSVEVVAAKPLEIWSSRWDVHYTGVEMPLLLSCPLTEPLSHPSIVSIVTEPCDDPTNGFYIEPSNKPSTYERNFTICVKDMNFQNDISQTLVEWIETNKILGVEKIDIYVDKLDKRNENVLLHYQNQGYVRLFNVPIKSKPGRNLWQSRKYHVITYNDCLYRNLRESVFIIPLDVDEFILPKIADTLSELVKRLEKMGWNSSQEAFILIKNVFYFGFMQGIDKYQRKKSQTKNEDYIKRDDVRIKRDDDLVVGEIELVDDTNINEVIDYNVLDEDLRYTYKSRCKVDLPVPKLVQYVVSSTVMSPLGHYSKSLMVTRWVLTAFNHYPLHALSLTRYNVWSAPFSEVQLNHYKESCNTTVMPDCAQYGRRARIDRSALRLRRRLTAALAQAPCTAINIT